MAGSARRAAAAAPSSAATPLERSAFQPEREDDTRNGGRSSARRSSPPGTGAVPVEAGAGPLERSAVHEAGAESSPLKDEAGAPDTDSPYQSWSITTSAIMPHRR